ncbi:MAG: Gfo/Idh/MocA family oxidoreductase [Sphingobacterium sp.]|nr:Gfo/Idh/MocA family oxidoreductase [Sphingobacterium sp.]
MPRHPRPGRGASGRIVGVCHVLRYTPYFRMMRHVVAAGRLGRVVSIQHLEPVEHIHMSHSFVRGNWGNSRVSTPMLLSKCCHDLDILRWIADEPCTKVQSFGSLRLFRERDGPARRAGPVRRRLSRRGDVPVLRGRDLSPAQDLARPQGHARRRRRLRSTNGSAGRATAAASSAATTTSSTTRWSTSSSAASRPRWPWRA